METGDQIGTSKNSSEGLGDRQEKPEGYRLGVRQEVSQATERHAVGMAELRECPSELHTSSGKFP